VEALQANVERLNAYKSKLVVFKKGDKVDAAQFQGAFMPVEKVAPKVEFVAVSEEMKKHNAFMGLRQARCDARNFGKRAKRAAEKAAEAQE